MNADVSIKVSVLVVTYNHEEFVRQALDSVLMQKTDFKFEVIVADDYSQDGTPAIAREYETANQHVRILPTEEHLGITRNYQRGFAACRGEYVAVLEGDDYWISPNRLSVLAGYLDEHADCVSCFHRVIRHDEVSDLAVAFPMFDTSQETFTARDLARENFIAGFSTCMYRREVIARLDPQIWKLKIREWPFNLAMAQHGLIGYVPEILSVYRAQPDGIWSLKPLEEQFRQLLEILDPYNQFFNFKYDAEFQAIKRRLRPEKEIVIAGPPLPPAPHNSRLRRWVKPFVPPILLSLMRAVLNRDRRPS